MKWKKELQSEVKQWVSENGLIEYGGKRLQDFLEHFGITDTCYRRWIDSHPEFKEAIDDGKEIFKSNLTIDLAKSLAEVAKGYEREETETEYRPNPANQNQPTILKQKRKKVHFQPNVGAAIFLLTNLDPEHYQQRSKNDITLRKDDEKEMTIDEINAEIDRLNKLDKNEK